MKLEYKIGNMMIVGFHGTTMSKEIRYLIHTYHVGAIVLFSRNCKSLQQIQILVSSLQEEAKKANYPYPLYICLDQESGVVRRIADAPLLPGAFALHQTHHASDIFTTYAYTAQMLLHIGVQWNLAPVADINTNPYNPVIGVRSFGNNIQQVAHDVEKAVAGMQSWGLKTTLKHFPGHGDTNVDSHLGLPTMYKSLPQLQKEELVPFAHMIDQGYHDAIMISHVHYPQLDIVPASISKNIITHLLKETMNFQGVAVSDCMEMNAITDIYDVPQACLHAIQAGIDFVMISHTFEKQVATIKYLIDKVHMQELSEDDIDLSLKRTMAFRNSAQVKRPTLHLQELATFSQDIYKRAITILKDEDTFSKNENTIVLFPKKLIQTKAEDSDQHDIRMAFQYLAHHVNLLEYDPSSSTLENDLSSYSQIVLCTYQLTASSLFIDHIANMGIKKTLIVMRNPYDLHYIAAYQFNQIICTYEATYDILALVCQHCFHLQYFVNHIPLKKFLASL